MELDLTNLIGKELRRVTFLLKEEDTYRLVFSVIEELLPDMQDYSEYTTFFYRESSVRKEYRKRVCIAIDRFILTKDFLEAPNQEFIMSDKAHTKVRCPDKVSPSPKQGNRMWVMDSFKESDLNCAFPSRPDPKYMKCWIDGTRHLQSEMTNDQRLMKQYGQVSRRYYGIDLSKYPEFIGNIYLLRYNPYFKSIDWTKSVDPPGVFAKIRPRQANTNLDIQFINRNKAGLFYFDISMPLGLSVRNQFFRLPESPDRLSVYIKNEDDELVYAASDMSFISAFFVNMNIQSQEVSLQHRDGSTDKVDKFVSEEFSVGRAPSDELMIKSPSEAYRMLEDSLQFAFFDGSKDTGEREKNRNRARDFVKRIVARASRRCIIADPYFNLDDLTRYVYTMPQTQVAVRILGAKDYLVSRYDETKTEVTHKKEARAIVSSLEAYRKAIGDSDVLFRLFTGKSPLHDRYIVVDDDVWLLGSSFNEIGLRACTILKLPSESARPIIDRLDSWWTNHDETISIEEYAKQP